MKPLLPITLCSLWLFTAGCTHEKQPQPIMVSSAFADGYAIGYPDRLGAETNLLLADKQKANELSQKLGTRASEFKSGPDPRLLLLIVKQSDETGRGEAFASANDDARGVREFWEEEHARIAGRVNGAAQKQLSDAKCTADVGGAIGYALKDGVDKQLEKRLRAQNEAHRTIDRNRNVMGANLTAVQKLADDIAYDSYLVNIALVLDRNRIDRLLSERDDVDKTLVAAIDREREFQAGPRSANDKKLSQERVAEFEKSRATSARALANAEAARKDVDSVIEYARKDYATALQTLETDLQGQIDRMKK